MPALAGVERSLKGARWIERAADPRLALALAQRAAVPEIVGRLMAARGVGLDAAADHLAPTLRAALPDPSVLRDMDVAAERIAAAILQGGPIAVLGDYDVDGATSAALILRWARRLGVDCLLHVPDRIAEGYGPNLPALRRLAAEGAALVIAVDCGSTAFEVLDTATAEGIAVIVLDHHAAEERLPRVAAVVNPNRVDQPPGLGQLAACGVTFLTLVAANRVLRRAGFFADGRPEPDLRELLDLVALGTVADVVPLTGLNRALVTQGLRVMARRGNPGLAALADVARLSRRIDAWHVGWSLGPRINAAGRIGQADIGARLLASDDPLACARMAALLDAHNADRKAVEADVLQAAIRAAEAGGTGHAVMMVAGEGWHPGVIGIVAGRLKERYRRPVCVVATEGRIGKASGRSVAGIDLGAAVIAARRAGMLMAGGGHPMAAGFTVATERISDLHAFLDDHIRQASRGVPLPQDTVPLLLCDGTLDPGGATAELVALVDRLGPFGAGNPEPRFVLPAVTIRHARVVGEGGHVSVRFEGAGGAPLKGIAFRSAESPLGAALLDRAGAPIHLAGTLRQDEWNGRSEVCLHIEDAAPALARSAS